ncbi:MAG: hypothetical protein Kow00108_12790 [Calditrichia bacterium]
MLSFSLNAQIVQRDNFGSSLEPVNMVYHGAGQSPDAFANYWNVQNEGNKPCLSMFYLRLLGIMPGWGKDVREYLSNKDNLFIIPQIGLSLTIDGVPDAHYEHLVALGMMDDEIERLITGLKQFAGPVFLRIGYEFNGLRWNGYLPESYKAAFRRIVNRLREENLEVATVWNFAVEGESNYMDYYPGDDVVDWWSINIFEADQISNPISIAFIDSARQHNKPVMIGEATPRYIGSINNSDSWNLWFDPFFQYIYSVPHIKGFCYINWDWSRTTLWPDWGDARLEIPEAQYVLNLYQAELNETGFLHASSERQVRSYLGYNDNEAPQTPSIFSVGTVTPEGTLNLSWNDITDNSGISHYIIRKSGVISEFALNSTHAYSDFSAGDSLVLTLSAMDRAGNESPTTPAIVFKVPDEVQKIRNGDFENALDEWSLIFSFYATAYPEVDSLNPISGHQSMKLNVTSTSSFREIELRQVIHVNPSSLYDVSFAARASSPTIIYYGFGKTYDDYSVYALDSVILSTQTNLIRDSLVVPAEEKVWFSFWVGNATAEEIWLDDISVIERYNDPVRTEELDNSIVVHLFELRSVYPNPFNSVVKIDIAMEESQKITVEVFDLTGRKVTTLFSDMKEAGEFTINWKPVELASGLYFIRAASETKQQIRKCIYLK